VLRAGVVLICTTLRAFQKAPNLKQPRVPQMIYSIRCRFAILGYVDCKYSISKYSMRSYI